MTIVKPFRFFVVSTEHSPHHFAVRNRRRERLNPRGCPRLARSQRAGLIQGDCTGWEGAGSAETALSFLSSSAITSSCDIIIPKNSDSVNIIKPAADITYDRYRTC